MILLGDPEPRIRIGAHQLDHLQLRNVKHVEDFLELFLELLVDGGIIYTMVIPFCFIGLVILTS